MKSFYVSILLLILLSNGAYGQICDYEVNETDPLTDDIIRTIKTRLTAPTPYYYFYYIRNGSDYKFRVEVGDYGEPEGRISEDSELIMRTGDDAIYKMPVVEEVAPQRKKEFATVINTYDITFQMTEEAMKSIAASGIKFIRIAEMQNSFSDQVFPDAVVEISKEHGECIFK
ncbi:MAG: hypothetical protein AAF789_07050 [Bacteroidota bacterium]